jgi:hypothetical protein
LISASLSSSRRFNSISDRSFSRNCRLNISTSFSNS